MSNQPLPKLAWYQSPTFWFIAIGVAVGIGLWWMANGQPGAPLREGDYSCSQGKTALGGNDPAATVQGGKVADVWSFDLRTRSKSSLPWSDAQQKSATEFTVTTVGVLTGDTGTFVCTFSE